MRVYIQYIDFLFYPWQIAIYEDKDGARKDEIAALGGQTATGSTNVFSAFYDRLKEVTLELLMFAMLFHLIIFKVVKYIPLIIVSLSK